MRDGVIVTQGNPRSVVTTETMREVFAMNATVINDPTSNTPLRANSHGLRTI